MEAIDAFPQGTAEELNNWLTNNFRCFSSDRAYEEFKMPIPVLVNGVPIIHYHRIKHVTIGIIQPERDACLMMLGALQQFVGEDNNEVVFVRRKFAYENGVLTARLGFWDPVLQDRLEKAGFAKTNS